MKSSDTSPHPAAPYLLLVVGLGFLIFTLLADTATGRALGLLAVFSNLLASALMFRARRRAG